MILLQYDRNFYILLSNLVRTLKVKIIQEPSEKSIRCDQVDLVVFYK